MPVEIRTYVPLLPPAGAGLCLSVCCLCLSAAAVCPSVRVCSAAAEEKRFPHFTKGGYQNPYVIICATYYTIRVPYTVYCNLKEVEIVKSDEKNGVQ